MRKLALWLTAVVSLSLAACSTAAEPASGGQAPAAPAARVTVRREANYLQLNNQPTLLLWAQGLTDPEDLENYQATGFNTLYVRVTGSSPEQLQGVSNLISAAEKRGLLAVVALAPASFTDGEGQPLSIDADKAAYANAVSDFAQAVAKGLTAHPRLIAWLVEAVPPDAVAWGDEGFRAFLQEAYPSVDALNASWGSGLESPDEVTAASARDIDSTFPAGLGRASVDLAAYREETYAKAMSLWAKAIRAADPGRPVFASAITDYRSIASVTPDFDGFALNVYPSIAEGDWETHNVHAVDIARRANQFAAVQTLEITGGTSPSQVAGWADLALLHGAAGVAFTNWAQISGSEGLSQAVKDIAEAFANDSGFPQTPMARVAVLYSPIAGGATRNGQGLYGYVDGVTPNEPTALFSMVRDGCRYGQFDVLTLSSLREADLSSYGAIIAPMALYLPEEAQLALQNFVLRGGWLVVDAGVGMYQAEGGIYSMPAVVRDMLGMRDAILTPPRPADQLPYAGEPGSAGGPSLGTPGDSGLNPLSPVERGLEAPTGLQADLNTAEDLWGRADITAYLGEAFVTSVRARALGEGFAVYVPVFLYEDWDPDGALFVDLHWEILSRKADVEMIAADALWPETSVAVYQGWPIAVSAVGGDRVVIDAFDAESQMYRIPGGAMRMPNPEEDNRTELVFPAAYLALGHPVPIYLRPLAEGAVVTASVVRYGADGIELFVHGTGAQVGAAGDGLQISGGESTPVEIEIKDGAYSLARGSLHHLVITDGPRARPVVDQEVMPNADTGSLLINAQARWSRITIEKVSPGQ